MTSIDDVMIEITPQVLLKAYACGIFPMAESAEDPALYWIEPERRGIIPLDRFHLAGRLAVGAEIECDGLRAKAEIGGEALAPAFLARREVHRQADAPLDFVHPVVEPDLRYA